MEYTMNAEQRQTAAVTLATIILLSPFPAIVAKNGDIVTCVDEG